MAASSVLLAVLLELIGIGLAQFQHWPNPYPHHPWALNNPLYPYSTGMGGPYYQSQPSYGPGKPPWLVHPKHQMSRRPLLPMTGQLGSNGHGMMAPTFPRHALIPLQHGFTQNAMIPPIAPSFIPDQIVSAPYQMRAPVAPYASTSGSYSGGPYTPSAAVPMGVPSPSPQLQVQETGAAYQQPEYEAYNADQASASNQASTMQSAGSPYKSSAEVQAAGESNPAPDAQLGASSASAPNAGAASAPNVPPEPQKQTGPPDAQADGASESNPAQPTASMPGSDAPLSVSTSNAPTETAPNELPAGSSGGGPNAASNEQQNAPNALSDAGQGAASSAASDAGQGGASNAPDAAAGAAANP